MKRRIKEEKEWSRRCVEVDVTSSREAQAARRLVLLLLVLVLLIDDGVDEVLGGLDALGGALDEGCSLWRSPVLVLLEPDPGPGLLAQPPDILAPLSDDPSHAV